MGGTGGHSRGCAERGPVASRMLAEAGHGLEAKQLSVSEGHPEGPGCDVQAGESRWTVLQATPMHGAAALSLEIVSTGAF